MDPYKCTPPKTNQLAEMYIKSVVKFANFGNTLHYTAKKINEWVLRMMVCIIPFKSGVMLVSMSGNNRQCFDSKNW